MLDGTSGPGGELHGSSDVAGGELAGTSDSSDEPDGTGGRLKGISLAHTAGRALEGTSGPGGELHGSSEIAGGEMEGTIDPGDEPEGTGTNPAKMAVSLSRPLAAAPLCEAEELKMRARLRLWHLSGE